MPEISRFYGIVIKMHFGDHPWPHFHARCEGMQISVDLRDGAVTGEFPQTKLRLVRKWLALHYDELMANWRLLERDLLPRYIDPLD